MTDQNQHQTCALSAKDYKSDVTPVWCLGCGDYAVLNALTKTLSGLCLSPEQVAVVSGIGCSSRIPAYLNTYGFHGVHGRANALATGLKLTRPDLTVIVTGGDGDGYSIGGNHFLHACRRNVDMTYIVMDNRVYGMTKGQPSPTTEADWDSALSPGGTGVHPFNVLGIALSAGANFIARGFAGDPNGLAKLIADGVNHPGFSFIEVLSPCVTFRADQKSWKHAVSHREDAPTDDVGVAGQRLLVDDGFTLGAVYVGNRAPYALPISQQIEDVSVLAEAFVV